MPQIGQQEYKVIAPKEGRAFNNDAAALGELKKSILNGIGFDCLIKDTLSDDGDINRVLGFYPDGSPVAYYSIADNGIKILEISFSVTQYQGLAAVQEQMDEAIGLQSVMPDFETTNLHLLATGQSDSLFVCVDGKYLTVTGSETIEALTIAETGPAGSDDFINITWEDAQKLIGLPLV